MLETSLPVDHLFTMTASVGRAISIKRRVLLQARVVHENVERSEARTCLGEHFRTSVSFETSAWMARASTPWRARPRPPLRQRPDC